MQEIKQRIGVIFGGRSGEHEVSLLSAASVIRALDREKFDLIYLGITRHGLWKRFYGAAEAIEDGSWEQTAEPFDVGKLHETIDFALPIVHGPYGEDGKLQGLLEMMDIPYGGCGVTASAVAMDKAIAKDVFLEHGLPICRHVLVTAGQVREEEALKAVCERIEETIGYPCFIKPANMGSSVGISKASARTQLETGLKLAARYDKRIVIEEYINCREIETGVIGNRQPKAATVGEILPSAEFYNYETKYADGGAVLQIPAALPEDMIQRIRALAVRAYEAIDGEGYARVDFFIDKDSGKLYLNEINTIPGFTKYSMFPLLWQEAGLEYGKLLERIIELGNERYYDQDHR